MNLHLIIVNLIMIKYDCSLRHFKQKAVGCRHFSLWSTDFLKMCPGRPLAWDARLMEQDDGTETTGIHLDISDRGGEAYLVRRWQ